MGIRSRPAMLLAGPVLLGLVVLAAVGLAQRGAGASVRPCDSVVMFDREIPLSLRDLVAESSLVASGRLEDAVREVGRSEAGHFVYVAHRFSITDVLKGVEPGPSVEVQLVYGEGGCLAREYGATPMLPGRDYVLFLRTYTGRPPYVIVGGSSGAFSLGSDGRLTPLAPDAPTSPGLDGLTVAEAWGILVALSAPAQP